ncbi:MAG: rod-binding protein [Pseudomonadota bacterium]
MSEPIDVVQSEPAAARRSPLLPETTPGTATGTAPGTTLELTPETEATYRRVAQEFEAVFLAEMLKHTGLGRPPEHFGGGAGEAQFAPMLAREHATALAERGGIGLAESIYQTLVARGR